jgi:hypothetical protein
MTANLGIVASSPQCLAIYIPSNQSASTAIIMPIDNITVLRSVGDAADVSSFVDLVSSKACGTVLHSIKDGGDFARLQRQGYSALVLAALSKGLQLYTNAAAAAAGAGQQHSSTSSAVSKEQQQLVDWLGSLTMSVTKNFSRCSEHCGTASQQAKKMEQELVNSGESTPLCRQGG